MIQVNQGGRARDPDAVAARILDITYPAAIYNSAAAATQVGVGADTQGLQYGSINGVAVTSRQGVPGDVYGVHQGRFCVRIPPAGVAGAGLQSALNFPLCLTRNGKGGSSQSVGRPFCRMEFELARSAAGGVDGTRQGVYVGLRAAGNIGLADVNGFLFGIGGDGAGGWKYLASRGGGVITAQQAIVWPDLVTNWVPVQFRMYSATETDEARFELWVNGARVRSEPWGAGSPLPIYTDIASSCAFGFAIRCADVAGAGITDLVIAGFRIIVASSEDLAP